MDAVSRSVFGATAAVVQRAGQAVRRHRRDVLAGGRAVLRRKSWSAARLAAALPLVLLVRLLRPIVCVRFGPLHSHRLGHFLGNTELYLCEREAHPSRRRTVDLFYHVPPICNEQVKRMWERILPVWSFARTLDRVSRQLPGSHAHVIPMPTDRDVHGLLAHSPAHLTFTQEEMRRGEAALRVLGIPERIPFVCFHARDSAYLQDTFPNRSWGYHDYRDSSIHDYVPAAEELVRRGYAAVRLGAVVKEPLAADHPRIIDYAWNGRSDFLDVFLGARCRFAICSATGVYAIPMAFRRPIAFVNYISLEHVPTWSAGDLCIPKRLWLRGERRFLTFREIFHRGIGRFLRSVEYERAGIEPVENTPEEITALAVEMDERLEGTWQPDQEDEELQQRFWALFPASETNQTFRLRIGAAFLRQHRRLLE